MTSLTPRQVARELGLPLAFPSRKARKGTNSAPSWDKVLDWAVDAYWERQGNSDQAA